MHAKAEGLDNLPAGPECSTVSHSPGMQAIERAIADIAPTDIPVLLVGESGTGKEWLAAEIHRLSPSCEEPFVKVSCASLTVKALNAWSRRTDNGRGKGQKAIGTVFLDEISDLEPPCQGKLLPALPGDNGVPLGPCLGARVIASTWRNLQEEVRAARFRGDLYYRINGVCLRVPPLRQRKEDIPTFVDFFLNKYATLFGRPQPSLSPETLHALMNHSWPGNIRELENAVRQIVVLGEKRAALLNWESSPPESRSAGPAAEEISLKQAARAASSKAEGQLISKVLARTHWNRKRAARELQISYKALLYKLKQLGLNDPAPS